uniref:Uncharacterized protein n=1 Tax=Chromera velia CCMP2878 TaxID=1169474 RepID=A0A0G4H5L8_9ALVE|eukprot:Cvel_24726.t1-p1 / transcript=Cvel_24726.t1 / gene=Cvel_24726 / organism=Chromera_velia_CCMP2878 / gene_product=hypothetical protein / transcript_product=hypothetical protein / location=Cvel_scaffold2713:20444-21212(+) / protein_length=98 / sequence_SO=supercontig / SO=protein_coding / is_pseudo=false
MFPVNILYNFPKKNFLDMDQKDSDLVELRRRVSETQQKIDDNASTMGKMLDGAKQEIQQLGELALLDSFRQRSESDGKVFRPQLPSELVTGTVLGTKV